MVSHMLSYSQSSPYVINGIVSILVNSLSTLGILGAYREHPGSCISLVTIGDVGETQPAWKDPGRGAVLLGICDIYPHKHMRTRF